MPHFITSIARLPLEPPKPIHKLPLVSHQPTPQLTNDDASSHMRLHNNSKSLHVPCPSRKAIFPYQAVLFNPNRPFHPPTRKTPTRTLQSHSSRFVKLQLIIDKATTQALQTHSSRLAKTRLMFYPPIPQRLRFRILHHTQSQINFSTPSANKAKGHQPLTFH